MNGKLSEKEKLMAYILNKEMDYSQKNIADFMATKQSDKKVSQSTIANAVKEAGYWVQIKKLQNQYSEAKKYLADHGFTDRPRLIETSDEIVEIAPDETSFFDKDQD